METGHIQAIDLSLSAKSLIRLYKISNVFNIKILHNHYWRLSKKIQT